MTVTNLSTFCLLLFLTFDLNTQTKLDVDGYLIFQSQETSPSQEGSIWYDGSSFQLIDAANNTQTINFPWIVRPEGIAYINQLSSSNLEDLLPSIDRDLVIASNDDVSTGLRLQDFGNGGESYSIVSTNNSSSLGGGRFIIFNETGTGSAFDKARMTIHNGNTGFGTTVPKAKLHISDGDVYIEDISKGVIMKSPDGNCWRYSPDNTGTLIATAVICP